MLKIDGECAEAVNAFLLENEQRECVLDHDCDSDSHYLCGYFESEKLGGEVFKNVQDSLSLAGEVSMETVAETNWVNEYKKHCQPWSYQQLFWIPLCRKNEVPIPSEYVVPVYIDSGLAFGTGMHESTRLCARALIMFVSMFRRDDSWWVKKCIDVGCGTGILGISALKCGLQHALLIDSDEDAIATSKQNAGNNGIDPRSIDYSCSDLKVGLLGHEADLIFANILADVLIKNADILVGSVRPGGMLCLSGMLLEEVPAVRAAFEKSFKKFWTSSIENSAKYGNWNTLIFLRG
ncbi:MAG: 50S ribosomal protein L11 methyltransferase [Puniceicoccales bacterium]|jgi:ribosomal protein L11 methyltransferase|nr:50S ribosomal protein L11 methyltransferase [Puniceicoccales bacterium]